MVYEPLYWFDSGLRSIVLEHFCTLSNNVSRRSIPGHALLWGLHGPLSRECGRDPIFVTFRPCQRLICDFQSNEHSSTVTDA